MDPKWIWSFLLLLAVVDANKLPSLWEYYTAGGIQSGLQAEGDAFKLNSKDITILSGALHYFRVHPDYWRDRMRKMKACGLNTVDTYVPWNLHEPVRDQFDFGEGDNDMSLFLNITRFIEMVKEEDMFLILRPGPYICSEWEFGGLPSWLLAEHPMFVRTMFSGYVDRARKFLEVLLPRVNHLQFKSALSNGGPIIAVQVENEYGLFGYADEPRDTRYMELVLQTLVDAGIQSLFLTSDTPSKVWDLGAIDGVLMTANFQSKGTKELKLLRDMQPNRPLAVMEYWTGWYFHWFEPYHKPLGVTALGDGLEAIFKWNSSVNFYMFHGGTSFSFLSGANVINAFPYYVPDITSYDYDAPLSEAGDYTEKYEKIKELILKYHPSFTKLPQPPAESKKGLYPSVKVTHYLDWGDVLRKVPESHKHQSKNLLAMESVGQDYGYIVYRKMMHLKKGSVIKIRGHVRDLAQVFVDGTQVTKAPFLPSSLFGFGFWVKRDKEMVFPEEVVATERDYQVDIIVMNFGRANAGQPHQFIQKKGLWEGPVLVDGVKQEDWEIVSLPFKNKWVKSLSGWKEISGKIAAPCLLKATFTVQERTDTWLHMGDWNIGIVFLNGFHLGRYVKAGPQKTLYIPAPLLKEGLNEIVIFEQYTPTEYITFSDKPDLGAYQKSMENSAADLGAHPRSMENSAAEPADDVAGKGITKLSETATNRSVNHQ